MRSKPTHCEVTHMLGIFLISCLSVAPVRCASFLGQNEISGTEWVRISEAFNAYLKDPSPLHGRRLVKLLPNKRTIVNDEDRAYRDYLSTLDLIFSPSGFGPFMLMVQKGDHYAVEAAFRIFNFSDGGAAESIMIILGDALRDHPGIFLEVIDKYRKQIDREDLLSPAVMTRCEVGSEEERRELGLRIEALNKVRTSKFTDLKNALIDEIERYLKNFPYLFCYLALDSLYTTAF